jgi:hypothetical protein
VLRKFIEQYVENQRHKRELARRRWEQEERWREEDRAIDLAARAAKDVSARRHGESMRRLAGVSYIALRCHEDTWTFMARAAFGVWEPSWSQSTHDTWNRIGPDSKRLCMLTVDPNLPEGRITKGADGMQDVLISGHNLVRVLDALRTAARSDDPARAARGRTLYERISAVADMTDATRPAGKTTGIVVSIDDSLSEPGVHEPSRPLAVAVVPPVQTPATGAPQRQLPVLTASHPQRAMESPRRPAVVSPSPTDHSAVRRPADR